MDLDGLAALLTPQGWALLEALPPYDPRQAMTLAQGLRDQGHDPGLVSAALTQSRLRAAARAKFGPFADGMLFTRTGLEQATRLPVAARHARRFAAAGVEAVADLGCGIGADAMALAGLDRRVLAVEHDEPTAAVATVNLRHWPEARVICEDATTTDLTGYAGVFLDPARRTSDTGRRLLDPRHGSPPLSFAFDLAARLPAVGVKTAPGIDHELIPDGAEAQWVSVDGEVVEAGLWFGATARDGVRRAALVVHGETATELLADGAGTPPTGAPGPYLYEPDGAVIRAGLLGEVTALLGGRLIDPTIAYVTGDRAVRSPLATAYAVEEIFGFQLKRLRTWLRDRGVGRLTIKKRGTAVDPQQLRHQLRLQGDAEATIVLTRIAGRQSVIAVHRLPS